MRMLFSPAAPVSDERSLPIATQDLQRKPRNWQAALWFALAGAAAAFSAGPIHAQTYTDLYDFDCSTGCTPEDYGQLTRGADGNLYGTAFGGGAHNYGAIFKVSTAGTYTPLWYFDVTTTGLYATGALTLATLDGNFYGTTYGSQGAVGPVLFRFNPSTCLSPATCTLTILHSFSTTEGNPWVAPVEGPDHNLYGTTQNGFTYRVDVAKGTYQLLPHKIAKMASAPLYLASDGYLYGTTQKGGKNHLGTIFRMNTAGKITVIYSFGGSDGSDPFGPLVQGPNGDLYGTTYGGGTDSDGTVFELALSPVTLTTLHSFSLTDGGGPQTGLLVASDGNFYGTTRNGGANGVGTLFKIAGGIFTKVFDFAESGGSGVPGSLPLATMMQDTNGIIYGLTNLGGGNNAGVFYGLSLSNINPHISLCCNWWISIDQPVTIFGENLSGVIAVSIGTVSAQFSPGSDTYLTAQVPSTAIDGPITVTLATGLQVDSEQNVRVQPVVANLDPSSGAVGTQVHIVGGGFAGTTKVTFGGVEATNFTVLTPAMIQATVPTSALTGKVGVVTPNGSAKSKVSFTVN
jgi:uncharacterized repeat protein (TIGR03803 family)